MANKLHQSVFSFDMDMDMDMEDTPKKMKSGKYSM